VVPKLGAARWIGVMVRPVVSAASSITAMSLSQAWPS
jgi:hypothetical protein